jgi:hypothetical protein
MRNVFALGVSSALAAMLVVSAPAHVQPSHAQHQEISEENVRAYFEQLQQEAMDIVRNKEFERIDEVVDRHIAEGAVFAIAGEMIKEGKRKTFMAATLEREDVMAMKHQAVGMMQGITIEDYTLDVEVGEVRAHGTGAATVKATWTDKGAIRPATLEAPDRAPPGPQDVRQEAEARSLTFERTFECHHVIQREGGQLKIGLTTCQGEVRL